MLSPRSSENKGRSLIPNKAAPIISPNNDYDDDDRQYMNLRPKDNARTRAAQAFLRNSSGDDDEYLTNVTNSPNPAQYNPQYNYNQMPYKYKQALSPVPRGYSSPPPNPNTNSNYYYGNNYNYHGQIPDTTGSSNSSATSAATSSSVSSPTTPIKDNYGYGYQSNLPANAPTSTQSNHYSHKQSSNSNSNSNNNSNYLGEARIVAPNVSKLSPSSAVEIKLQNKHECVAVLCSVDVLKMRSGHFHDLLNEQERIRLQQQTVTNNTYYNSTQYNFHPNSPLNNLNNKNQDAQTSQPPGATPAPGQNGVTNREGVGNNNLLSTTSPSPPQSTSTSNGSSSLLWRQPIIMIETSPFEAAAFLESLHEGKAFAKGEWNSTWARLSVTWEVEELITEYASEAWRHISRLLQIIANNHWRTNPSILSGNRISVFRKGNGWIPTIVTGVIVEAPANIGYSKVRVAFEDTRVNQANNLIMNGIHSPRPIQSNFLNSYHGTGGITPSQSNHSLPHLHTSGSSTPIGIEGNNVLDSNTNNILNQVGNSINNMSNSLIGDVTEPFWIQPIVSSANMNFLQLNSPSNNSSSNNNSSNNNSSNSNSCYGNWIEPDEYFNTIEAKKLINNHDKKLFWEMIKALVELPSLRQAWIALGGIPLTEMANLLKKNEHKVLWLNEATDCLPRELLSDLVKHAYVIDK